METVVDEQIAAANSNDHSAEFDPTAFSYSSEDLRRLEFYQNVFQKDLTTLSQYLDIVNEHAKFGRVGFVPNNDLDLEVNSIFQTTLVNSTYFYLNRFYDSADHHLSDKLMSASSFLYSKKFVESVTNPKYSSNENRLFLREQIRFLRNYLRVHGLLNDNLKKSILSQLNKYLALVQKSGVVPIQINSSKLALC